MDESLAGARGGPYGTLSFFSPDVSRFREAPPVAKTCICPALFCAPGSSPRISSLLRVKERSMNSFGPFIAGSGKHRVEAFCRMAGKDLVVSISGGESPHVGAAALAVPREKGRADCVGLLCAPGHRDDMPAHALAKKLCSMLGRTVCLTVGLHVDDAGADDIALLVKNAEEAVIALAFALQNDVSASPRV